jgi:hypothetical protein
MSQYMQMVIKGIAQDAHPNFPIKFDYGQSGTAFLVGCRVVANVPTSGGKTIEKRMDIRAFGDVAEQLAHLSDGMEIEIKGTYDMQQNKKDNKWYPIVTVDEVISA